MSEAERLKAFLMRIHESEGKVCQDYDICEHVACASSYGAWAYADAALSGQTLEAFSAQQNQLHEDVRRLKAGEVLAITISCHYCRIHVVVSNPKEGESVHCSQCGAADVKIESTERDDHGFINNCALRYEGSAANCQMCLRGPCPEAAKFRGRVPPFVPFPPDED